MQHVGVYMLAPAYAGTSNNGAIRRLLYLAVSERRVRRAAVTSLSFLFKNFGQAPRAVQLLSEGYNPHARCGAANVLGIACAGTELQVCLFSLIRTAALLNIQDAVETLEPMTKHSVDFVRQGVYCLICLRHGSGPVRSLVPFSCFHTLPPC